MDESLFPSYFLQNNRIYRPLEIPEIDVSTPDTKSKSRSQPHQHRHRHRKWLPKSWFHTCDDGWKIESAALILCLLSLASIFLTLGLYNGRSLADWKEPFSLNSVIAVLGTLMKGSAMLAVTAAIGQLKWNWFSTRKRSLRDFQIFDDASRGPLGGAWFLAHLHLLGLSSLGVGIVIFALATDTFIQSAITYPLRRTGTGSASIPVSQNYSLHGSNYLTGINNMWDAEASMKAAVYGGGFTSPQQSLSSSITPTCSSGNCSFPTYSTMEVHSQCTDETAFLAIQKQSDNQYNASWDLSPDYNNQTISLAAGPNLANYIIILPWENGQPTNQPSRMWIANVSLLMFEGSSTRDTDYGADTPNRFHAYSCQLYLAAQSYRASVIKGKLIEIPYHTFSGDWSICWTEDNPEVCPYGNGTIAISDPSDSSATVSISLLSFWALSFFLAGSEGTGGILNGEGNGNFLDSNIFVDWTNDLVKSIWDNGAKNVNQTFANIAKSMTNTMRTTAGQEALGTSDVLESYIRVQWAWLALPTAVVVAAEVFFGLTVWQTRRRRVPIWKLNSLSVVLHGLENREEWEQKQARSTMKISEMEAWADVREAKLSKRKDGGTYGLVMS